MASREVTHEAFVELCEKYCSLVWYARSGTDIDLDSTGTEHNLHNAKMTVKQAIREKYPQETADLESAEDVDWHHGFNSGMLAAMRHALNILDGKVELANSEFQNLDT